MRSNTTISIKDLSRNNFLSPKFKLLNISNTLNTITVVNIEHVNDKLANSSIQTELDKILANTVLIKTQADNYYNIGVYLTNIVYDTCNLANSAVDNVAFIVNYSNTVNNWSILVNPIVNSRYSFVNSIYNNISNASSNIISALYISTNAYSIASGVYNKAILALNTANTANDLTVISIPLAKSANTISLSIENKANSALLLSNSVSKLVSNVISLTSNTSNITFSVSNTATLALNLSVNAHSIATQAFSIAQNANTIANGIFNTATIASNIANTANLTAYNAILAKGNASLLTSGTINSSLLGSNVSSSSILYGDNIWKPLNANLISIINLSGVGLPYRYANNIWIIKNPPTYSTDNLGIDIQEYSSNITNSIMTISEITTGSETKLKGSSPSIIAQAASATSTVMERPIGGKLYKSSGTFTPVLSKLHRIIVIGAGGSGAATVMSTNGKVDFTGIGMACGGGAGGCSIKDVILSTGTTYTVTIGTGGSSKTVTSTLTSSAGSSGGSSSFSGSGISTITASGGGGGQGQSGSGGWSKNGGSGGTSSGGDYNFTGGKGGNCTYVSYGGKLATGGGAVSITGNVYSAGPCKEGDVPFGFDQTTIRYYPGATGGAGIGGNSGQIETYAAAYAYCATGGGGTEGESDSFINPGSGLSSGGDASLLFKFNYMYINNPGGNAGYPSGSSAYDGGGGGGGVRNEGNATGGNGGMFGGGGAACCGGGGGGGAYNATAGNGGIGGGGGGALAMAGTAQSGSGGNGLIIILW